MNALLDRLSRRGDLTITAKDGNYDVLFKAPGPYQGRAWCTTDESDFWSYCHLGASNWHDEGDDLDELLAECEEASRPPYRDIDDLRWAIEMRRESRTYGPPLPSFLKWHGWRPGDERWLHASSHATEYLDGYLHHGIGGEQQFLAEQAERDARAEQFRVRRVLGRGGR